MNLLQVPNYPGAQTCHYRDSCVQYAAHVVRGERLYTAIPYFHYNVESEGKERDRHKRAHPLNK